MPVYGDDVVVLRAQPLGEADRLLSLFGRERGLVRAVARGVRRTSSKFGARLEPFTVVEVQLFTRNPRDRSGLETVTQAVTIDAYTAPIVADYAAYTAASVMVETCERLIDAEPAPQQWALLVGALRSLARAERTPQLVLDSYLLRSLSLAGWQPDFVHCARCGAPGPHRRVSFSAGGAVCDACAVSVGATTGADTDALRQLWALMVGNWRIAEAASPAAQSRASEIVAGYVEFHLERTLRSMVVQKAERRIPGPDAAPR